MRFLLLAFALLAACGSPPPDSIESNSPVLVNELSSTDDDPIELVNRSTAPVDLTGWYLQDEDQREDKTYVLPTQQLAAGAYLVLRKGTHHVFGLSKNDKVYLYDADGNLADVATWDEPEAAGSFCRSPDITGDFKVCTALSLGVANP